MKENGYEYVDLGLPSGTMWSTCNVGASKPEDNGLLFQFGRVDGYKYGDTNHKFKTNDQNKQDTGNPYIPKTASGKTYDVGETLDLKDDAAHVNMGGIWRMPTNDELQELIDNTTQKVETINEVQGIMFTSTKPGYEGKQLFIPFVGYWLEEDGGFMEAGSYACMRSSQVLTSFVGYAYLLECYSSGDAYINYFNFRSYAFSVRGVFKK